MGNLLSLFVEFCPKKAKKLYKLLSRKIIERSLFKDVNFNLDLVQSGFKDRKSAEVDPEILHRIVVAYQKSKIAQRLASPVYHVGNEWLPIYERSMGNIIKALSIGDFQSIQKIYSNFFRDQCSDGLVGYGYDENLKFFQRHIDRSRKITFLVDTIYRYNLWKLQLGSRYSSSDLVGPDIGNPFGCELDGVFVRSGSDYMHYYSVIIARYLSELNRHKVVMEIGGGFGGMAYYLLRDNPDITYIDFDLPENMALTAYFLMLTQKDKKFLLYGEKNLSDVNLSDYAAVIMPNFEIEKMNSKSADITFNSYSLAEMSSDAIANYVSEIQRICSKYFLHVNHTRNCVVSADKFGIDSEKFHLMHRAPALWNLGRNPDMDEFEFLYKRIEG